MTKERSPRFPFVPLRAALTHLTKINQAAGDGNIRRPRAIEALGYDAPNGRVNRLFAAMRGYGLLEVVEKGVLTVTPLGKRLLKEPEAQAKGPWLTAAREAVLNPPIFRRFWRNLRNLDREQLVEALLERKFTEQGAEKAAEVFTRNRKFAGLDDMPAAQQEPQPGATKQGRNLKAGQGQGAGRPLGPPRDAVVLPLGNKRAIIPTGISETDYQLLLETLTLWKAKIVKG
jgi:hypothetical protein